MKSRTVTGIVQSPAKRCYNLSSLRQTMPEELRSSFADGHAPSTMVREISNPYEERSDGEPTAMSITGGFRCNGLSASKTLEVRE